ERKMSTNDNTTPKTNDKLIIVILPIPSILPSQHHPTQDLDKEHLILIINAEIEETDMISKILLKLKAIKYVSVTFSKTGKFIIYRINLDDLDYDREEDDDYNVDSGQS
ncbi:32803_t:CDS:2, partial [Gigaspora margarita]